MCIFLIIFLLHIKPAYTYYNENIVYTYGGQDLIFLLILNGLRLKGYVCLDVKTKEIRGYT